MSIKGKKLLLGMTGGIACYKIPVLVRLLRKAGVEVRVVMTDAATKFITPLTMETVSNNPVGIEIFPSEKFVSTHHINLSDWADLTIIAPATANFIGKAASGISDDLLTTIICANRGKILAAPSMNPGMWSNPITQRNVKTLQEVGFIIINPEKGDMACDHWGKGRLVEPVDLFEIVKKTLLEKSKPAKKKVLKGKRIIVTAGPCREPIDPVRFISNRSSGKMGYALAREAMSAGGEVTLISGPVSILPPDVAKFISVETTQQMYESLKSRFKKSDCLIMAAAPADFKPAVFSMGKIKKSGSMPAMNMKPTIDILARLGSLKRDDQILIGFALETSDGIANARKKLKEKNLDMILLNSPLDKDSAFDHDTNQVTLIRPGRRAECWPLLDKNEVAAKVLDRLANLL